MVTNVSIPFSLEHWYTLAICVVADADVFCAFCYTERVGHLAADVLIVDAVGSSEVG